MEILKINSYTTILKFKNSDIKEIGVLIGDKWGSSFDSYWNRITNPTAVINGGFFGSSLSTVVSAGNHPLEYNVAGQPREDMIRNFGLAIPNGRNIYAFRKLVYGEEYDYIGAIPFLLYNGRLQTYTVSDEFESAHPRSFIGSDDDYFYMGTIDGRQVGKAGSTLKNLANLMLSLGWKFGMNLDGGNSTKMVISEQGNMKTINSPSGDRAVGNVVYVCEKNIVLPTIRLGSDQEEVKMLRDRLKELGYVDDFYFGTELERLLKKYQSDKGLVVDGICGKNTWASLGLM